MIQKNDVNNAKVPSYSSNLSISSGVIFLLALTCAFIAAGSYLVQPILPQVSLDLSLGKFSGFAVSLTQIGFCIGLILIAPLGDLIENKLLVLIILTGSVLSLLFVALVETKAVFFIICFMIGLCSTAVQILIPFAASMVSLEMRGRVMGAITSGLLIGIMLARPVSSYFTYVFGWKGMFFLVGTGILILNLLLMYFLPKRKPEIKQNYKELLFSLFDIFKETPRLRSLALCQAFLFSAFSLFWTTVPFQLVSNYGFNQRDIALFALIGAGGAFSSFFAGRIKDATKQIATRIISIVTVSTAFILIYSTNSIGLLILAAILIDAGVQFNHVLTQRTVIGISPTKVNRLNSLYVTCIFVGGAIAASIGMPIFTYFGWKSVAVLGSFFSISSIMVWYFYIYKTKN